MLRSEGMDALGVVDALPFPPPHAASNIVLAAAKAGNNRDSFIRIYLSLARSLPPSSRSASRGESAPTGRLLTAWPLSIPQLSQAACARALLTARGLSRERRPITDPLFGLLTNKLARG